MPSTNITLTNERVFRAIFRSVLVFSFRKMFYQYRRYFDRIKCFLKGYYYYYLSWWVLRKSWKSKSCFAFRNIETLRKAKTTRSFVFVFFLVSQISNHDRRTYVIIEQTFYTHVYPLIYLSILKLARLPLSSIIFSNH